MPTPHLAHCLVIGNHLLRACVNPLGAELPGLRTSLGHELIWPGDPQSWPKSAPILFPIIGRLRDGRVRHRGCWYAMPPHGFAMNRQFVLVESKAEGCVLQLRSSQNTRDHYPFEFALDLAFTIAGRSLTITASVRNTGDEVMPFAFGFHPGLRWPVRGASRSDHRLVFEAPEHCATRRRAPSGLIGLPFERLPLKDKALQLDEGLFAQGPHVMDVVASRSLIYADPGGPLLRLGWRNLEQLALWSLPGAGFLCVEPWHGLPEQEGVGHDLADRPGMSLLAPGGRYDAKLVLEVDPSLLAASPAESPPAAVSMALIPR